MCLIKKDDLIQSLLLLGQKADQKGLCLNICLSEAGAMMLAFDSGKNSFDCERVLKSSDEVLILAKEVADEIQLNLHWLNDSLSKLHKFDDDDINAMKKEFCEMIGLQILRVSAEYLFVMKALTCCHQTQSHLDDIQDLSILAKYLNIDSMTKAEAIIEIYYPLAYMNEENKIRLNDIFV